MSNASKQRVPFLALDRDHALVRDEAMGRIQRVLDSQGFVLGAETTELEATVSGLAGADHAVACSSGSDALLLALMALGVGAGDAVVVPSFTFFATAGAAALAGATASFVDVDEQTFRVGPAELTEAVGKSLAVRNERLIDARSGAPVKAVILVHLYGAVADVAGVEDFLSQFKDPPALIEDAAQALGASRGAGRAGSMARMGCFSFYPTKNIGGAGDGGAVTTNDARLAEVLRSLRVHGAAAGEYLHTRVGMNARMSELQAAYLNAKLPHLQAWTSRRREIAARYRQKLAAAVAGGLIELPNDDDGHVYHQFTLRIVRGRDGVQRRMAEDGVDTRVFYPVPLHMQPCFSELGYAAHDLPRSERAAASVLSLPIYPAMDDQAVDAVVDALVQALDCVS